jgi:hypothetical protein
MEKFEQWFNRTIDTTWGFIWTAAVGAIAITLVVSFGVYFFARHCTGG